ncbi:hypothetical protein PDE_04374 [Penicillium oxalicum 114-2]|uniref:Uncharacterized protein n=1 Tax=Penicillium oxalicum (strain 114-2 / CGMCC 5302) TaxID=933388 RepID=S7ZFH9_PENO1|nr:hypothetical protein PDE_04374 [Penicillium oxalicum 114-2]
MSPPVLPIVSASKRDLALVSRASLGPDSPRAGRTKPTWGGKVPVDEDDPSGNGPACRCQGAEGQKKDIQGSQEEAVVIGLFSYQRPHSEPKTLLFRPDTRSSADSSFTFSCRE